MLIGTLLGLLGLRKLTARRKRKARPQRLKAYRPCFDTLEDRLVPSTFTMTSPTSAGALPTGLNGVTEVGGVVLDIIGSNGTRVVTQLAASTLFRGFYDNGTPSQYEGNPLTIGIQTGFTPGIVNALGGGISEFAIRITLYDGDTGPGENDEDDNILVVNGSNFGNFSDVATQETSGSGNFVISSNNSGGFRNNKLDTGFFYSTNATLLSNIYNSIASTQQVLLQLLDLDLPPNDDAPGGGFFGGGNNFKNFFDFTQGLDGGLVDVGRPPTVSLTLTVSSQPNPSNFGSVVTFTATLSGLPADATGTITFFDAGASIGSGAVNNGLTTFTTSSLSIGTHPITASYSGDTNYGVATSGVYNQTVKASATTTVLNATPVSAVTGQPVTFVATVSSLAGQPTGSVTFKQGSTVLAISSITGNTASFSTSSLAVGPHIVTATYGGDANFASSTSDPVQVTVSPASTTIVITSSPNPSTFGQPVTFTATIAVVAPGGGSPGGSVTFKEGDTVLAILTLTGGPVIFTTSGLPGGTHGITGIYSGDSNYLGSSSAVYFQTVNRVSTTTSVTSSINPAIFGQVVSFTATVNSTTSVPAGAAPTGNVTFMNGTTSIGTAPLVSGKAVFTPSSLSVGVHPITASYGGDVNFQDSTSGVLSQTVNPAATTTVVTSSPNPSVFGQIAVFTATVTAVPPSAGFPTGNVTFLDGGTLLAISTLTNGQVIFTTSQLVPGAHSITARYSGDANFLASTSLNHTHTVNRANTSTAVVSTLNPSTFGQEVSFIATVSAVAPGAGTPTGVVTFRDGATTLGTAGLSAGVNGNTATFTTASLPAGNRNITAVYGGDFNFNVSTSTTLTQTVNKASTATSLISSPNPSVYGQTVTFTANVSVLAPGAGNPTGFVTFFNGAIPLGATPVSGGTATFATSSLPAGNNAIGAVYGGDANFFFSSSTQTTQTVNKATTVTSLSSSATTLVFGQLVSFTATVSVVAPGAGTPTGVVTFQNNGNTLGTVALSGGQAILATTSLPVGLNTISVLYSGDSNFSTSLMYASNRAGAGSVAQLFTINLTNGAGTLVGNLPTTSTEIEFNNITLRAFVQAAGSSQLGQEFNIATAAGIGSTISNGFMFTGLEWVGFTLYGTSISTSGGPSTLRTLDPFAGTSTAIGLTGFGPIAGLAYDSFSGTMYGITGGTTGNLLTIDLSTGAANLIGPTGFQAGSLEFGPNGLLYAGGTGADEGKIFQVNPATGASTFLGITGVGIAGSADVTGLALVGSVTAPLLVTVNKAATTTTLIASANPSVIGQAVTFQATVTANPPGSGIPTGVVTFMNGATPLGTATLIQGVAAMTTTTLPLGSHSIRAVYEGDINFLASTSSILTQVVNKNNTTTTVTSTQNPGLYGNPITFTAAVTVNLPGSGTPTGSVNFMDGTVNLGNATLVNGVATLTTTALTTLGTHAIRAFYNGDGNSNGSTSAVYVQTVKAQTTTELTASSNLLFGVQGVTFTATVNSIIATPTGSVSFYDGPNLLGTSALNGHVATLSLPGMTVGDHTITAVYPGDVNFFGSSSDGNLTNVQPAFPFFDDFNRADSANLGNNYAQPHGTMPIQLNQVSAGPGFNLSLYTGGSAADVVVQGDISLGLNGQPQVGLVARYQGPADRNMYLGQIVGNNGTFTGVIMRNTGGVWATLAQAPSAAGTGTLRFEVVGNSLKLFLNGTLLASALDSVLSQPGLVGIRTTLGNLDNFYPDLLQSALPFNDDFNRPDSGNLGSNYKQPVGSIGIAANQASTPGGFNLALYANASLADVSVQIDVALASTGFSHAGLVARYKGPGDSNMYLGELVAVNGTYSAVLYRNIGGAWSALAQAAAPAGAGTLRLDVQGNTLKLFLSNTLLLSAVDNAITGPGQIGIRGGSAALDNFSANSLSTITPVSRQSDDFRFVDSLYQIFLKRQVNPAAPGGAISWVNAIGTIGRAAVIQGIMRSTEAYQRLVQDLYAKILARPAGPGESSAWVSLLQGGGTEEQVISGLLSSTEFGVRAATLVPGPGTSDQKYIGALYLVLLGRTGNAAEINGWLGMLSSQGRAGVAMGFLAAPEFRIKTVQALYAGNLATPPGSFMNLMPNLLYRSALPGSGEVNSWLNGNLDLLSLKAAIAATAEFYDTAPVADRLGGAYHYVNKLYETFLGRSGDPKAGGELSNWVDKMPMIGRSAVAEGIIRSSEGLARLVNDLYVKILGRPVSGNEDSSWVGLLLSGGTEEQVVSGLLSSSEFAARASSLVATPGTSDETYVRALYALLLGRTANILEVAQWVNQLPSQGRFGVAASIMSSTEFRIKAIRTLYGGIGTLPTLSYFTILPNLLKRPGLPPLSEISVWLNSGRNLLGLKTAIASSDEYYKKL